MALLVLARASWLAGASLKSVKNARKSDTTEDALHPIPVSLFANCPEHIDTIANLLNHFFKI